MIISSGRRYIFVHIPKTGGTSLTLALEGRAMKDDILIGDTPKARQRRGRLAGLPARGRLWKHATLADIEGAVSSEVIADSLIVALVRNPWDRIVSYYHWLLAQEFAHPAVRIAQDHDFTGFLTHPHSRETLAADRAGRYVTGSDGVERPALFMRLEHLAEDIAPFEAHLGFRLKVPAVNRSERARDHRGYYSDATRALVAELCAEDIARFGYRF